MSHNDGDAQLEHKNKTYRQRVNLVIIRQSKNSIYVLHYDITIPVAAKLHW